MIFAAVRQSSRLQARIDEFCEQPGFSALPASGEIPQGHHRYHVHGAAKHDLAEQHTSDVSAVAKWANPILKATLDAMEEIFNENNDLVVDLPKQDQLVLKWADMLALLIYCKCQHDLGNKNMNVVFSRGVEALSNLERLPEGQIVLNWLVENYAL